MTRSADRVALHTARTVNVEIKERTNARVAYFRDHPDEIPRQLKELAQEWDIERALAATSACLTLLGVSLGLSGKRRWFYLPLAVQGFYLQHTLQGWCPPLPLFRRLGFRTPAEIERERCALKALVNDLNEDEVGHPGSAVRPGLFDFAPTATSGNAAHSAELADAGSVLSDVTPPVARHG